jgi:type II secretory pathway pseudopilin PulG
VAGTSNARISPAAFTIVELIMVIGVLSVLLAILMPGTKALREASYRRRAAAEATALAQAAIRYKTEYGFWPGELEVGANDDGTVRLAPVSGNSVPIIVYGEQDFINDLSGSAVITLSDDNPNDRRRLFQCFSTVGHAATPPSPSVNPFNPRGIRFLDLKKEGNHDQIVYHDPWDKSYSLFMGLNPRDSFSLSNKVTGRIIFTVSNQTAIAFSRGVQKQGRTNYFYSAGVDSVFIQ